MKQRSGLFLLAFVIFIIGLGAGAAVYVLADEPEATAYVIIGDTAYPVDPATSKAYQRQLERYGGKMAVVFDGINRWVAARFHDFDRWFAGLWRGKRLGITIASLGVGAAALLLFLARRAPPD